MFFLLVAVAYYYFRQITFDIPGGGDKVPCSMHILITVLSCWWIQCFLLDLPLCSIEMAKLLNVRLLASADTLKLAHLVFHHSAGWFIGDTVFIIKRRQTHLYIFVIHHILALIGLSLIFSDDYRPLTALLFLEIGGGVHHLRTVWPHLASQILFHSVYPTTRLHLLLNLINSVHSPFPSFPDILALTAGTLLVILSLVWWFRELFLLFPPSRPGTVGIFRLE
jgi:hypothetical protein